MPAEPHDQSRANGAATGGKFDLEEYLRRFAAHDELALYRLMTRVENRMPEASAIIERIYAQVGRAHVIGITGPPGAGKSTLVNRLITKYRALGKEVAVLAIDPSSPFSGGAVLGDRVRMTDHYKDPGVHIRSLSSRGSHGGLSRAAREIVKLLDAFGHDVIIIETVGVGQTELGIMDLADTTVVVTVPEGGDSVQVMKAGLNEIADVFVVNKSDREGADRIKAELELNVHLRPPNEGWRPPVIMTQAAADQGVDALVGALGKHREYVLAHRDEAQLAERRRREFMEILATELEDRAIHSVQTGHASEVVEEVESGRVNPYSAARRMIEDRNAIARLLSPGGQEKAQEKR
ncbi:MAG: methylmalonyl Co-A mutase-associated GTPase MeaB [Candidatus Binataceae bacterium]